MSMTNDRKYCGEITEGSIYTTYGPYNTKIWFIKDTEIIVKECELGFFYLDRSEYPKVHIDEKAFRESNWKSYLPNIYWLVGNNSKFR